MNQKLLKSIMILKDVTDRELSQQLGIANVTLWRKMNGTSLFTQGQISTIRKRLHLTDEQVINIFFAS